MTLNGSLSIVIPEIPTKSGTIKSSQHVDVPINNISNVDIRETIIKSSTYSEESYVKFVVIIYLARTEDHTMFVNAAAQLYPLIRLAFDDRNAANTLRVLILKLQQDGAIGRNGQSRRGIPPDRSEALEFDDRNEISPSPVIRNVPKRGVRCSWAHTDLADGFESNHEIVSMVGGSTNTYLAATAAKVNHLLDQTVRLGSEAPTGEELLPKRNRPRNHDVEVTSIVNQFHREKPQKEKSIRSFEVESNGMLAAPGIRSPLDIVAMSSAQWRDGANAIDNAPELVSKTHDFGRRNGWLPPLEGGDLKSPIEIGHVVVARSRELQIDNGDINKTPSAAVVVGEVGTGSLLTQVSTSATNRKGKASKISQSLLDRDGKHVDSVKTDGRATRPSNSVKSAERPSRNHDFIPEKKKSSKKKVTHGGVSKVGNHVDPESYNAEPGNNIEGDDVFAIPDSPILPGKTLAKSKQKKPAPKRARARPANPKSVPKATKAKSTSKVSKISDTRETPNSRRAQAPSKAGTVQESGGDSEALVNSDNGDLYEGQGNDNEIEENQLMTISDGKDSARKIRGLPTKEAKKPSDGVIPKIKMDKPSAKKMSDKKTAMACKNRKPVSVAPTRQSTRRAAAIQANYKLQSVKSDGRSRETGANPNHDRVLPESHGHVRRSDKAGPKPEKSASKFCLVLSPKSPPDTTHDKKSTAKQSSIDPEMAASDGVRPSEAEVGFHDAAAKIQPSLLTASGNLSNHTIEQVGPNAQDSDYDQHVSDNPLLVPSVESKSPEGSVNLVTIAEIPDAAVEQHFEHAARLINRDDEISFSDTFLGHKAEPLTVGELPQLQNFNAPSTIHESKHSFVLY